MKKNYLGLLSLLALIGLLGIITPNKGYCGFFGFAYYLRYFWVTPDELFRQNVRQAAAIGFFSGVTATALLIVGRVLLPLMIGKDLVLLANYIVSLFCFTVILAWLEIKEMRGC